MRLGLFMMPIHDPARGYLEVFKEDRESILHAEALGYDEAWVGEHYACKTEPIPDPLQFMATLIPVTQRIKFGTAVLNLPQHHPAVVAGNAAQFDQLSEGRFIMGVGPGGLGSDFELFQTFEKNRAEMMAESIDMIHRIWASDPPYRLHGKYWDIVVDQQMQKHLGIGPMLKPYQKPYPPLAMSVMSPRSGTARFAGERGWGMISANFTPAANVKTHWEVYRDGATSAGRKPDRGNWRVARSIVVTETDAEARDYLANENCSPAWYYKYLRDNLATYKLLSIFKPDPDTPDAELTWQRCLELMLVSGSPKSVLDQLVELVDRLGYFGTLLVTQKDWDDKALHKKSMRLLAEAVMPKLSAYAESRQAAE
jgi:alkanesulfonate monooxygenase SsuD/methylene tetrahydromethanopterin reductase-like flavin-dependent oxidoreductase (luciferase family)